MLDFCESQQEWMAGEIERLARAESPSTDKAALDLCGALVLERFASLGCRVQTLRREAAGDHIRAETGNGDRQALVLGHFDTVWPVGQIDTMPVRRDGDKLFGPGVFDMKAGIVIALTALRALQRTSALDHLRVVVLCTADEEVGSETSRETIESEARRSEAVLVLEPSLPGGAVKTSRKGVGEFQLTVRGVAAHAGIDPGKGSSAIHELARQIVGIERLQDPATGVSVNVGIISGGSRSNVVAEHARATIDVRAPRTADARLIEDELRALRPQTPGTSLSMTGGFNRPALERTAGVVRLYELAKDVARGLGRALDEGGTGGGSDGSFTAALGIPTLDGLGAEGDGAHASHEHVLLSRLPWRAALVAGLLERLAKPV
ncbi:MAG TPA: M20 family metallopeptidase [Vicinamibacterales bacterium]|nr:M20 family metallopeptidase [Vicinamibacterales bacterium]